MKIVLIGGHLSPALSVMEALPKDAEVLFIGRKYSFEGDNALSLEYKTITERKIPFVGLNTGRLQRKLSKHTFPSLFKLPFGIVKSFLILFEFKPDVVVGFGGYVSIPVVVCAYILRIPVVIHEQTLEAGFANKFLARFAAKICISWSTSNKYFPKKKTILTGNPIRKFSIFDFRFLIKKEDIKRPLIYIAGGSSGSHFINTLIEEGLDRLLMKYNMVHQAGDAQQYHDFSRLERLKNTLPEELRDRYTLKKFVDPSEVGSLLKQADMVITRSGMNTITELLYFQKPALLIPLPFSQNNEQLKNARFLEKMGIGKVLQQEDTDSKKLLQEINLMLANLDNYKINGEDVRNLPGKNAAKNIVSIINNVAKSKTKKFL